MSPATKQRLKDAAHLAAYGLTIGAAFNGGWLLIGWLFGRGC